MCEHCIILLQLERRKKEKNDTQEKEEKKNRNNLLKYTYFIAFDSLLHFDSSYGNSDALILFEVVVNCIYIQKSSIFPALNESK